MSHTSTLTASWKGGFDGRGSIRGDHFSQAVTLPKDFKGLGEGATPEDLLLGSLSICYLITLGIVLDKAGVKYQSLDVVGELKTDLQPPRIREAILRVKIVSNEDPIRFQTLAERAESFCLIARAVEGNIVKRVEIAVEPEATPRVGTYEHASP